MAGETKLSPPLSLPALGLQATSTVDDALKALVRMRGEIWGMHGKPETEKSSQDQDAASSSQVRRRRGGDASSAAGWGDIPLPAHEKLYILINRGGSGGAIEALGSAPATTNAKRLLSDFGLCSSDGDQDAGTTRIILGTYVEKAPQGKWFRLSWPSLQGCRRRARRSYKRCRCPCRCPMPERLKPYYAQYRFYYLCVRWAVVWLWQDRKELFGELKEALLTDVWDTEGAPPPCSPAEIREELCWPFGCTFGIVIFYILWVSFRQILWGSGPPPEMFLDNFTLAT